MTRKFARRGFRNISRSRRLFTLVTAGGFGQKRSEAVEQSSDSCAFVVTSLKQSTDLKSLIFKTYDLEAYIVSRLLGQKDPSLDSLSAEASFYWVSLYLTKIYQDIKAMALQNSLYLQI